MLACRRLITYAVYQDLNLNTLCSELCTRSVQANDQRKTVQYSRVRMFRFSMQRISFSFSSLLMGIVQALEIQQYRQYIDIIFLISYLLLGHCNNLLSLQRIKRWVIEQVHGEINSSMFSLMKNHYFLK
jgi:hypothetical protein